MQDEIASVSRVLRAAYNEQYTEEMTQWRELGGKYKAANILAVCKHYKFRKVLECGAGEGSILKYLDASEAFSELYAIEISRSGISQIEKRKLPKVKEVKRFNGYKIPYPERYFEMAYCSHVFEHVEYPRTLLRELQRISDFQVFEIPLDYSVDVDRRVDYFLSYGHINIYTPSLFKFLLKSEGYEILSERLTQTPDEVTRYIWYQNMKQRKNLFRELALNLRSVRNIFWKLRLGRKQYSEYAFSAYTCLAKGAGELKIFTSTSGSSAQKSGRKCDSGGRLVG